MGRFRPAGKTLEEQLGGGLEPAHLSDFLLNVQVFCGAAVKHRYY